MIRAICASAALLLLSACATIVSGMSQDISVNTNPPGANCTINRQGQKIGQVNPTPGIAKVDKTRDDLTLVCDKDGYQEATFLVRSGFEATTIGNVFIGGLIGVGIDAATGANNHYDSPVNVTFVPLVAGAAPAPHDTAQPTSAVAAAPASAAKPGVPAPMPESLAAAAEAPKPAPPPSSAAAPAPTVAVAATPPQQATPGTWTAKLHWVPVPPSPRFSDTGESSLAYDVALTNVSVDANTLTIASEKSNIAGRVAGGTIEIDGWYKQPWGYVNSVHGSLTQNGARFTGQGTCFNTQVAASAPTTQMSRHFCNLEVSQVQ
jgi:hypothetical protein